ncbi:hypothetical protein [Leptolyngbya sp. 7M]|uniref:hypothetical protein n=1 Tax=Leptolyngbya sp. 7M TaxID=2812896 RepID=UPI001B8BFD00|nr:hypothetical protein [Leptolyngbya sp. 7M]QYO65761.1 hypothetical protein JVX88_02915 [Leptolyngbya sp. 7M]
MFIFFRILVFAITFFLGIVSALPFVDGWIGKRLVGSLTEWVTGTPPVRYVKPELRSGKVELRYAGWAIDGSQPVIRLRLTNGLDRSISYSSYNAEHPFVTLTKNGKEIPLLYCGTGATNHYIWPGETVELQVGSGLFQGSFDVNDRYSVRMYIKHSGSQVPEQIGSDVFILSAGFLRAAKQFL